MAPASIPPPSLTRRLATWFVRGLLITAPVALTLYICWLVIRWVDGLLGLGIPGAGIVAALVAITAVGALASTYVTRIVVRLVDHQLQRLPFVRLLYTSTKDLLSAFVGERRRFNRPVRVAISEDGAIGVLGFVTAESLTGLGLDGQVAVYLPQSYNFAGQLLVVPATRVTPLDRDSAEVMAFIVSGGVAGGGDPA